MLAARLPKTFTTLSGYTRRQFLADLQAGVVVGVVAIPLALAFAIASGVAPEKGLVTAVVAGFLISFLGGSRVQIGGPTGAFVVIVYGIVAKYGIDGLTICTVLAGLLLVAMGLARFGGAINVPMMDASGIRVLDDLFRAFRHQGVRFVIAGIHAQPLVALDRAGRLDEYGRENIVATLDEALHAASKTLAGDSA